MFATTRGLTIAILLAGCGSNKEATSTTSSPISPEPSGTTTARTPEPAATTSQQPTTTPNKTCAFKKGTPGMLCAQMDNGVLHFEVFAKGCYSSSCTTFHQASCSIAKADKNQIALDADFCIEERQNPNEACTADCGSRDGSWVARCDGGQAANGNYKVTAGDLTLTFTTPLKDQVCVGSTI